LASYLLYKGGESGKEAQVPNDWLNGDRENPEPWEGSSEAWRGDEHPADEQSWLGEMAVWDSSEDQAEEEEVWADEPEFADWPEDMAGPEYWLYKRHTK
jgi:hypothetical protein